MVASGRSGELDGEYRAFWEYLTIKMKAEDLECTGADEEAIEQTIEIEREIYIEQDPTMEDDGDEKDGNEAGE